MEIEVLPSIRNSSQMNAIHITKPDLPKVHFNIILSLTRRSS
jgi:hypothetical protein